MFQVRSFDAPLGAEVIDIDLGEPVMSTISDDISQAACR